MNRRSAAAHFSRYACGLLLLLAMGAQAQQRLAPTLFREDAAARQAAAASPLTAALFHSRPLSLDVVAMRATLAAAPLEGQPGATSLTLVLPLPDGRNARFAVREAPVMAPALAAQFPEIRTYAGIGLDDANASVRLDVTPQGFHAQILSAAEGTVFIDPVTRRDPGHYLSFFRRDMNRAAAGPVPACSFQPTPADAAAAQQRQAARNVGGSGLPMLISAGPSLRTYRLALANTPQYAVFHGNTAAGVMAAKATSVNRVVGVYEKELAVRLVLVASNSSLNFLSGTGPQPSPAYNNGSPNALLSQNQSNIDNLIGTGNYDIGHVFSTAGGGLAGLGVVCRGGQKAQGETGTSSPAGDAFDIDYVAHEIGHQFGANHTFNGTGGSCGGGNRNTNTAYEPGSGTTIMAYAGICGAQDDVQNHSDAYFHTASFEEIEDYLATTSCATTTSTSNSVPTVSGPAARSLPIGTPFRLTATGSDANGDALTYCWEEFDLGSSGSPTSGQMTNDDEPLFRSFLPVASPTRYFPRLSDIINNTATLGERLPTVTRDLKFRVTARDQHSSSTGVVGGVSYSATVGLTTNASAGPFLVTAPNTAVSLGGGTSQSVTWDVAGTTANGINCATVNVLLSTDGGLTYPTTLVANTPNDGSVSVTLPNVATTTARIMVEAANNYFFDISNVNFTITSASPCAAPTSLSVGSITQTTASVSFAPSASAVSYTVTTVPASTTQTVTASPVSLAGLTAGTSYTVNIVSTCAGSTTSLAATASFTTTAPPVCNPPTGLSVGSLTATSASVSFTPTGTATNYTVTTVPATTIQTVTTSPASLTGLLGGTNYTVNVVSNCAGGGTGTASATFATPPSNNKCTGAIVLNSAASCVPVSATLTGATQSQAPSTCSGSTSTSALDVWFIFTATGSSHTIDVSSTFDGVLQVYFGTCSNLTNIGCIDHYVAGGETAMLTGLAVGAVYTVRYYPFNSAPADGSFTICLTGAVPPAPTVTAISPAAELPGLPVTITGTRFVAGSTVAFGGVAATSVVVNSPTSITATVPAGAAVGNNAVAVTSGGVASASAPAFAVLKVYDATTTCLSTTAYTATGDGQWHYLLASGQVVAALQDTRAALGSVQVQFRVTGAAGAVRQDGKGHKYLDRNFRLTATNPTFTGSSVNMRFYGLASEMGRLQAADATVTYASLKITQYQGTNEDCDLTNDNFTTGEFRVLAAPANTPAGVPWFVAQANVADHFSEFFLTGSSVPLPVELVAFEASLRGTTVQLSWSTASEKSSDRFEVERSLNGYGFEQLGAVATAGTSSTARSYAFADGKLPAGRPLLYYRLRQVDTDGSASYSPVRTVQLTGKATGLALFPNPTATAATLTGAAPGVTVQIFDTLGRVVLTAEADVTGSAALQWPAQALAAGVYLVRAGTASVRLSIAP